MIESGSGNSSTTTPLRAASNPLQLCKWSNTLLAITAIVTILIPMFNTSLSISAAGTWYKSQKNYTIASQSWLGNEVSQPRCQGLHRSTCLVHNTLPPCHRDTCQLLVGMCHRPGGLCVFVIIYNMADLWILLDCVFSQLTWMITWMIGATKPLKLLWHGMPLQLRLPHLPFWILKQWLNMQHTRLTYAGVLNTVVLTQWVMVNI